MMRMMMRMRMRMRMEMVEGSVCSSHWTYSMYVYPITRLYVLKRDLKSDPKRDPKRYLLVRPIMPIMGRRHKDWLKSTTNTKQR